MGDSRRRDRLGGGASCWGAIGAAELPVGAALAASNVAVGVGLRWFPWQSAKGIVGPIGR